MMEQLQQIQAQGGGYGPPPGGFGPPPGGGYGAPPPGAPGGYGPPPGAPGGMPMAPPGGGGMPGGMPGGGADPELKKSLDTWFIISLVSSIFCCGYCIGFALGVFGAVTLNQGKTLYAQGNVEGARQKFGTGKNLVIANIAVGLLLWIVGIVLNIVFGGLSAIMNN